MREKIAFLIFGIVFALIFVAVLQFGVKNIQNPSPTPSISETPIPTDSKIYNISVSFLGAESEISKNNPLFFLLDNYHSLLNKPIISNDEVLFFSYLTSEQFSPSDEKLRTHTYYARVIKGYEFVKTSFENELFRVIIEPNSDPLVVPYINDQSYCKTNSDCTIAYGMCDYGARNKYLRGFIGGCGPLMEPGYSCPVNVTYNGAHCQNNTCVGLGKKVSCIPTPTPVEEGILK